MSIQHGNSKLGKLIHTWTLPSGLKKICVGASTVCLAICYAMQNHFTRPKVKEAHERNYKESLRKDFVATMSRDLREKFVRIMRIHAGGEFYSAAYVRKWIAIAERNPSVLFFAYTRSWADSEVLPSLRELSRMPNVVLWWSCDRASKAPPRVKGIRRAYLMSSDDDIPRYHVDLVFRNKRKTTLKWVDDAIVCPAENGVTSTTCSQCQLCFRSKPVPIHRKFVELGVANSISVEKPSYLQTIS
jgi:hypothetical protein